jgi:O-antigen ligase
MIGLGAIGLFELLRSRKRVKATVIASVLATSIWLAVPLEQKARFSTAGNDATSLSRKLYWKNGLEMARNHPLFGIGYANWTKYYTAHYWDARIEGLYGGIAVSHNVFVECLAELGYVGLGAFVLLIVATFLINYQTRKAVRAGPDPPSDLQVQMAYGLDAALIGYLVSGFFMAVLYYPFFWINLALAVALNAIAQRRGDARIDRSMTAPVRRRGASGSGRIIPAQ